MRFMRLVVISLLLLGHAIERIADMGSTSPSIVKLREVLTAHNITAEAISDTALQAEVDAARASISAQSRASNNDAIPDIPSLQTELGQAASSFFSRLALVVPPPRAAAPLGPLAEAFLHTVLFKTRAKSRHKIVLDSPAALAGVVDKFKPLWITPGGSEHSQPTGAASVSYALGGRSYATWADASAAAGTTATASTSASATGTGASTAAGATAPISTSASATTTTSTSTGAPTSSGGTRAPTTTFRI